MTYLPCAHRSLLNLVASGCFDSYKIDYSNESVRDPNRGCSRKKRGRLCRRMVFWRGTTTKTGLIWAWTSRLPQAAKRPGVRARAAKLSAHQGSGAYTIATTSPPDLPLQSIQCEIVDAKQCLPLNCLCVLLRSLEYPRSPTGSYPTGNAAVDAEY